MILPADTMYIFVKLVIDIQNVCLSAISIAKSTSKTDDC